MEKYERIDPNENPLAELEESPDEGELASYEELVAAGEKSLKERAAVKRAIGHITESKSP